MTKKDQKMDKIQVKANENGVVLRKNEAKVVKKEEVMTKNSPKVENNVIVASKSTRKRPKVVKTSPKVEKVGAKSSKNTSKKGENVMSDRANAEKVLEKVVKGLKMTTNRTNVQNGETILQVRVGKGVKVSVRTKDIIIFSPHSYIGYGKPQFGGWKHVTVVKLSENSANLEKAFTKALKDKKSGADWALELGSTGGRVKTPVNLKARKKRLELELKAVNLQLSKTKKTKVIKKKSTKVNAAIEKVAEAVVA